MEKEMTASVIPCSARPLKFDDSLCVGCNRCADVCQVDIMIPNPTKGKHPIVIYPGECYYCGSCVMACPNKGAISLEHPLMNQKEDCGRMAGFFPFWDKLTGEEQKTICRNAASAEYPKGAFIHRASEDCVGVLLVKEGQLRVYMQSEDGRDITLFRIDEGEACVLSASCFMQEITFEILIDAEKDSEVLVIPTAVIRRLSQENIYVENFIYKQAAERFSDVMWTMQQILFMSFDKRLAVFLVDEAAKTGEDTLTMTHDQIARYTGSAREVVSRMLKYFEKENLVELARGRVKLANKKKLQELARK